jgi:hypothetical protein
MYKNIYLVHHTNRFGWYDIIITILSYMCTQSPFIPTTSVYQIYIQYTYIVGKYKIYLYEL